MIMEAETTLSPMELNLVSLRGTFFFYQMKAVFYNDFE